MLIYSYIQSNLGGFMNKAELVSRVAETVGLSKRQTEEIVETVLNEITKTLAKSEEVKLTSFGTFEVRPRKERKGVSPLDGQRIIIPAGKTLVFKPSKILKEKIK